MNRRAISLILISLLCLQSPLVQAQSREDIQKIIVRGCDLYERGHWADARHEFERACELKELLSASELERVDYYLAVLAVELGVKDGYVALQNFEKNYPGSMMINDIRFALACGYCSTGDFQKAELTFEEVDYDALSVLNRSKYDIRRGYVAFADNRYDQAYEYFQRVDSEGEYGDHALYYLSYIDYSRGDYQRTRQGFEKLLSSEAYGDVAPFYLLQLEFKEGNYKYVVENGDVLIAKASVEHKRDLMRLMSESWFRLEDYNNSLDYITSYAEAGGEMGREESYIRGFSLYRMARYAEAEEALRSAAGADDALTQNAAYHLADCYVRRGEKELAMQSFAMATNGDFNPLIAEDALYNYGKLQFELGGGHFSEAIHVLGRYLTTYPSSERADEVKTLLAAAYYNSEDYDAAYNAIKSLSQPDSEMRAAVQKIAYFRALSRYEMGDLKGAKSLLRESSDIGVSARYSSLAKFWLGEIAFIEGDYDTSRKLFNDYLSRAPKSETEYALAHYNIGYCDLRDGNNSSAAKQFENFISLYTKGDELLYDAHNRRADALYADRHFEGALVEYEQAAQSPQRSKYYAQYQRALTLGVLERYDDKIDQLRSIVSADRGDYVAEASYELGKTYLSLGRYNQSAEALRSFVESYPNSTHYTSALSDLGLIYANLGNKEESLRYYDKAIKSSPTSSTARGALQGIREIYVKDGNVDGYFDYVSKSGLAADMSEFTRDSLSFAAAKMFYLEHRTEDAARSLRSYVKTYERGAYLSDALLYLSQCYREQNNPKAEIPVLKQFVAQGANEHTESALVRLSELCMAEGRYVDAADVNLRLMDEGSTAQLRGEASENFVRSTVATGDKEQMKRMADMVLSSPSSTPKAQREAKYTKATILKEQGRESDALALWKELSEEVHSVEGGEAMYRQIEHHYSRGEFERAESLIFDFADVSNANNYWKAKSFIMLGDIYLKQGDRFQARATYQSVADGYSPTTDGIVSEAKSRISSIE